MGEYKNKLEGKAKEIAGKATGDRKMQAKGLIQKNVGRAEGVVKDAKAGIRKAANRPASRRVGRSAMRDRGY